MTLAAREAGSPHSATRRMDHSGRRFAPGRKPHLNASFLPLDNSAWTMPYIRWLTIAAIVVLLSAAASGEGPTPTLIEQPRFADGVAIAVVKQWLINANCISYYYAVEEWRRAYQGGGIWRVVAVIGGAELSEWRVYEHTETVDPVRSSSVGIC